MLFLLIMLLSDVLGHRVGLVLHELEQTTSGKRFQLKTFALGRRVVDGDDDEEDGILLLRHDNRTIDTNDQHKVATRILRGGGLYWTVHNTCIAVIESHIGSDSFHSVRDWNVDLFLHWQADDVNTFLTEQRCHCSLKPKQKPNFKLQLRFCM